MDRLAGVCDTIVYMRTPSCGYIFAWADVGYLDVDRGLCGTSRICAINATDTTATALCYGSERIAVISYGGLVIRRAKCIR